MRPPLLDFRLPHPSFFSLLVTSSILFLSVFNFVIFRSVFYFDEDIQAHFHWNFSIVRVHFEHIRNAAKWRALHALSQPKFSLVNVNLSLLLLVRNSFHFGKGDIYFVFCANGNNRCINTMNMQIFRWPFWWFVILYWKYKYSLTHCIPKFNIVYRQKFIIHLNPTLNWILMNIDRVLCVSLHFISSYFVTFSLASEIDVRIKRIIIYAVDGIGYKRKTFKRKVFAIGWIPCARKL